jgi:predicted MFS family arabinose efflux permease
MSATALKPSLAPALIGAIAAMMVAMGIGRFAYTPILPAMMAEAGLSAATAGLLASINYAGYFAGSLAAIWMPAGERRLWPFRACLLLSVATTIGMGFDGDLILWGVLRFLSGVASAGALLLAAAMTLDRITEAGRASLSGFPFIGVGGGTALSGLVVDLTASSLGWHEQWLALGGLSIALGLIAWVCVLPIPGRGAARGEKPAKQPLTRKGVLLIADYGLVGAGYIVTGTFLVALLKADPATAEIGARAWTLAGLAAMPSVVLWSLLGGRIGWRRALLLAHGVQALGILAPILFASAWAALAGAALWGGTFVALTAMTFAAAREQSGAAAGRQIALLTTWFSVGQMLGPLGAGLLADWTGGLEAGLIAAALAIGLGAIFLAMTR